MDQASVVATFNPPAFDRAALSKSSWKTLEALYQHPLSHNLAWADVMAMFEKLGTVESGPSEIALGIGGQRHRMGRPHTKELETADVMALRHMLTRAGWSPNAPDAPDAPEAGPAVAAPLELLAVVERHQARLYRLDLHAPDAAEIVIHSDKPHDDRRRDPGRHSAEESAFFERIAQALRPASQIVVVGHGHGHGNAAHGLLDYLRRHHAAVAATVKREIGADIGSLTAPQLLILGRRALS